jgi:hypothetical protein
MRPMRSRMNEFLASLTNLLLFYLLTAVAAAVVVEIVATAAPASVAPTAVLLLSVATQRALLSRQHLSLYQM